MDHSQKTSQKTHRGLEKLTSFIFNEGMKTPKPFDSIRDFILHKMRMSHVYQPVVLCHLLKSENGKASARELAVECLAFDEAQVEYYTSIVNRHPRSTLKKHGLISIERPNEFTLNSFQFLTSTEREELAELCEQKTKEYVAAREALTGSHRYNPDRVGGSLRFEVLRRAEGKCALCGVHARDRAIDADHIVPRSLGGSNELTNLQALCFQCNRGKGNTDQTDFRGKNTGE